MRKKVAIANWKMNKTRREAGQFCQQLNQVAAELTGVEVIVCPPYTALDLLAEQFSGTSIHWGGQNCFWEEKGDYTGEISPWMLRDLAANMLLLGIPSVAR